MKRTLTTDDIADALRRDDNARWSDSGAWALAEWLEELENDIGDEMELDVVAIRCDFTEYDSLQDWAMGYHGTEYILEALEAIGVDEDIATGDSIEDIEEAIRDWLQDRTTVIEHDEGVIVQSF